jgi:hypothetical protein
MKKNNQIIQQNTIEDKRGNLTIVQIQDQIPFEIDKIYLIDRFNNKKLFEKIISHNLDIYISLLKGSFQIQIETLANGETFFNINSINEGLFLSNFKKINFTLSSLDCKLLIVTSFRINENTNRHNYV